MRPTAAPPMAPITVPMSAKEQARVAEVHDAPPIDPAAAVNLPTWRAAFSDRTADLMAIFAQLAYAPFEEGAKPAEPGEPRAQRADGEDDLRARLAAGGFQLVKLFNRDDTQGFLAMHPDQFAVLAFRGTTSFRDWRTNLNAGRVPLPGRPGVKVHRGFLSAFACCRAEIEAAVDALPATIGLYITGHSLGGALAQIASAALERDTLAACYTFGSPRVGNEVFDREVKCPHYRVVNNWDVVPGVPLPWFWGYRHTGDPRLLKPNRHNLAPLRRDRNPVERLGIDLLDIPLAFFARRLLIVDDHMIWNYERQLAGIAQARNARLLPK